MLCVCSIGNCCKMLIVNDRQCTCIQSNANWPNNLVIAQKSGQKSSLKMCVQTKKAYMAYSSEWTWNFGVMIGLGWVKQVLLERVFVIPHIKQLHNKISFILILFFGSLLTNIVIIVCYGWTWTFSIRTLLYKTKSEYIWRRHLWKCLNIAYFELVVWAIAA